MGRLVLRWVSVCVLVALPVGGCSEETAAAGGMGGTGGSGGIGGYGGSTGAVFVCTEPGIRDAIAEGGGPHTFDCDGPTTVVTDAEIAIYKDVILDGEGDLTVDGDESHRVFAVAEGVTAELRGLTVTEGAVSGFEAGGGIHNLGMLTLTNTTVSGNTADSGGGIRSNGTLTLTNTTVSGNTAFSRGGGGIRSNGTLTLTNATVSGNTASQFGGGILNRGWLTLTNSTVSGNSGIGISTHLMAMLTNSTVSGDGASGVAIYNEGSVKGPTTAVLTITNSTVSGIISNPVWATSTVANSVLDGECNGAAVTSDGYNIESPGDTCGFDPDGTDLVDVTAEDLKLQPFLRDNGGPTMTRAPGPGSVAIDQIPAEDCVDADGEPLTTDQRGEPRPETGGTMCDVGSFEVQEGSL